MSSDISLSPTSADFAAACSRSAGAAQPLRRRITYVFMSFDVLMVPLVVVAPMTPGGCWWVSGVKESGADREGQRDRRGAVARGVTGAERHLVVASRDRPGGGAAAEGDAVGPGVAIGTDQHQDADLADAAPAVPALAQRTAVAAAAPACREAPDREAGTSGLGQRERDGGAVVRRRDGRRAPRADDEAPMAELGGGDHRGARVGRGRVMGAVAVAGRDAIAVAVVPGARPATVGADAAQEHVAVVGPVARRDDVVGERVEGHAAAVAADRGRLGSEARRSRLGGHRDERRGTP